jgi:3',5'-nucleoside bisphosphate phosphatase
MTLKSSVRADLHCHSTHSDGSLSPKELVALAKTIGLNALAITDHDAISSYQEALLYAKEVDICLLPGVELSTTYNEEQIHVLGYAFDPEAKALKEFCANCRKNRRERNREILERLKKKGMSLEETDLAKEPDEYTAYGRPHIAKAMCEKGYVQNIQEAFLRYIGEGKSCYVPGVKYSTSEAIEVIHASSGKAVIAHPHLIQKKKVVEALLKLPFDGLETYYSRFNQDVDRRWLEVAQKHALFSTGGSDFHGSAKPEVKLGIKLTPEDVFYMLWSHFQNVLLHSSQHN